MSIRKLTIRGQSWKVKLPDSLPPSQIGLCDYDSSTLYLPHHGSRKIDLDTNIHEMLHAGYPDLNEEAVNELSTDIAEALWRMGWRKQ